MDKSTYILIEPSKVLLRHEKEKKSMVTFALPADAPSPHWSSLLMIFLAKKQPLLGSVLPPA
jgi:hypothetical protein